MSNSCINQPINHSWQSEYSNEASNKVLLSVKELLKCILLLIGNCALPCAFDSVHPRKHTMECGS